MIGVIAPQAQRAPVEEFFQLFKTPWEFYERGQPYEVVLAADELPPSVNASLVIVYGAEVRNCDREAQLNPEGCEPNAILKFGTEAVPLYRGCGTFGPSHGRAICKSSNGATVGVEISISDQKLARIGYNLFEEINYLLTTGQPLEHALTPTLDLHIALLRQVIVEAGIPLVEVSAVPAGYDFSVCLTHDIDFVGIRRHKFDHTMWGFLYRSTFGLLRDFFRGRSSLSHVSRCLRAVASLPLVFVGLAKDFWMLFDWYLEVERGLSATYFFIPFKHRRGEKVCVPNAAHRASAYDIGDVPQLIGKLQAAGSEIGVHGIDAWHDVSRGVEEHTRVKAVCGSAELGIRMHWLLRDQSTLRVLDEAGYAYDSTCGYNETPGYLCGTSQVFRPLGVRRLLELPLHIQDGALFYPKRLGLSEGEAWSISEKFITRARELGGVLTLLWHDRSPGPERFWGEFYAKLVAHLKTLNVWFAHAGAVVSWFRNRRDVEFERVETESDGTQVRLRSLGQKISPPLKIKVHRGAGGSEYFWDGTKDLEIPIAPLHGGKPGVEALAVSAVA
jgi:hypothetical protein